MVGDPHYGLMVDPARQVHIAPPLVLTRPSPLALVVVVVGVGGLIAQLRQQRPSKRNNPAGCPLQYVTGLSMGGSGTWTWAGKYPERWAAIAPVRHPHSRGHS